MNFLDKLFKYQNGLAFVTVHWLLAIYLLIEKTILQPEGFNTWKDFLAAMILILDAPAITVAFAISWGITYLFGAEKSDAILYVAGFLSIFTVTFQWMIIGKIVSNFFSSFESRITKLSLKDE